MQIYKTDPAIVHRGKSNPVKSNAIKFNKLPGKRQGIIRSDRDSAIQDIGTVQLI